jgi:membrane peptidoglycan carboxypeptidase
MAFPQRPKYYSNVAPSATQRDMDNFIDEQRNADMLDAMSDIAYEQEQAMREQWDEPIEDQHEPKD